MNALTRPNLVPYVTLRLGEEPVRQSFLELRHRWRTKEPVLVYSHEVPGDRDRREVLWAHISQNELDEQGMPTGAPIWGDTHPARQRQCMELMRCQVCAQPAKTPLGYVFLAGPDSAESGDAIQLSAQPPVCAKHILPAAELCPHLNGHPKVFLVQRARLYGVHGVIYGYRENGITAIESAADAVPYGHANIATVLASQLVRCFGSYRVVDLDELMANLEGAA